jgi:hypothetical protein
VAEGINVPGYAGSHSEFLHQKIVPMLHIVDKVIEMGSGFVTHGPAGV